MGCIGRKPTGTRAERKRGLGAHIIRLSTNAQADKDVWGEGRRGQFLSSLTHHRLPTNLLWPPARIALVAEMATRHWRGALVGHEDLDGVGVHRGGEERKPAAAACPPQEGGGVKNSKMTT